MSASLDKIVDVNVSVSRPATIASNFNLGCIIGNSVSALAGTIKSYTYSNYAAQMVADGYATTTDEYKKATVYFAQSDKSSDLIVAQMNNGETKAEAFTRVRAANDRFYGFCFTDDVTSAESLAVAALVEATKLPTVFFVDTDSDDVLTVNQSNFALSLKSGNYERTVCFYSKDKNVDVAALGLFCGLNTMKLNSAYTFSYKTLSAITADNLSDTQIDNAKSYNCNVYCSFGNRYNFTYPGITSGGAHIDEVYFIDVARFLIQQYVLSGIVGTRKVPQTEAGVGQLISFIFNACNELANIGFIASGIWKGEDVIDLHYGDAVNNGFNIQAGTIASQSAADRAARVSPPIYVCLLSAGAIEYVVINVYVNE